ncbi:MAG TPA: efflux RND transporter periplasmic adaptor subunit, partial [Chroococcales cyanobacterium]
ETAGSAQKPVKLLSHPEIKTDQVKERQIYEPLHLFGVVEPEFGKETDISSTVSGRVTELFVKPGQSVKAGDSLAVVNSREISELQAELLEARSKLEIARVHENRERHIYHDSMARPKALNEAKAQFKKIKVLKELTEGEYNRQVDLYHEKIAAAKDYLAAKARLEQVKVEYDQAFTELERQESFYKDKSMMRKDLEVAQAETKRAKEHLNTLLQRLTFLGMDKTMEDALMKSGKISGEIKLTTQVSGSISHMDVAVGEMVDPEKSLMKITDLSSMIVSINVPEVDLRAVHLNSKVRIRFAGYPHKVFESKINYIGEHVHLQTRTVTAKAALPANSQGLFKLNMAAQVDVLEPPRTFLACPESAIHDLDGERIAFVQKPDGFELRKIVVGEEGAHYAEILKGLKDGEKVATEGSGRLRRELTAGH